MLVSFNPNQLSQLWINFDTISGSNWIIATIALFIPFRDECSARCFIVLMLCLVTEVLHWFWVPQLMMGLSSASFRHDVLDLRSLINTNLDLSVLALSGQLHLSDLYHAISGLVPCPIHLCNVVLKYQKVKWHRAYVWSKFSLCFMFLYTLCKGCL